MEDTKRELNKTKRPKSDHVRNLVQQYLQKRNYSESLLDNLHVDRQITLSLVESEIRCPNSILYSCYNSDPAVIDHNFTKFLAWTRDVVKNENIGQDLEQLIAPLFCHLYLDLLKGGHSEKATNFLKAHLAAIDKSKCDDFVRDMINLFTNDSDISCIKDTFRGNKYLLKLSQQSLALLKKFVLENCHVAFLHVLQTWFDLREIQEAEYDDDDDDDDDGSMDEQKQIETRNGVHTDNNNEKYPHLSEIIREMENEIKQIFLLKLSNTKDPVTCGIINRSCSLIAYSQNNTIVLKPIHALDSILGHDFKEIKLIEHTEQVFSITITHDHRYLISGGADNNVCIFELEKMKLWKECRGHLATVYCVAVSSNNIYIASGSQDQTARLWSVETGQTLRIFVGHTQTITCIDFHPNCLYLITGSADRNLRLWNTDNGECLRLLHGSKGIVYCVNFSPIGDAVVSSGDDKKIRVWDVLNSKINLEFKHKGAPITKVVYSGDGKSICAGSIDGLLRVWNVDAASQDQDPIQSVNVNGKVLGLEFWYNTFACIST